VSSAGRSPGPLADLGTAIALSTTSHQHKQTKKLVDSQVSADIKLLALQRPSEGKGRLGFKPDKASE